MPDEIQHVHGSSIPVKGEKVTFTNLNKDCKTTGDGIHSCYELIGHHQCACCEPKKRKTKKKSSKKKDN